MRRMPTSVSRFFAADGEVSRMEASPGVGFDGVDEELVMGYVFFEIGLPTAFRIISLTQPAQQM